jgi:hypothetical protein
VQVILPPSPSPSRLGIKEKSGRMSEHSRYNREAAFFLGSAHETCGIPLTEYCPIFRVPEYSELSIRVDAQSR